LVLLRLSIVSVGIFAFVFGLTFKMTEYVMMFMSITGAIVGGAGACIVLGLYWRRGTPAAAWTAMTVGWVMAIGRIILQQIGRHYRHMTDPGPLLRFVNAVNGINSRIIWFWIMISCLASYVVVSLLTKNEEGFLLERVLHRGRYAIKGDHVEAIHKPPSPWMRLVGITSEFSVTDRVLAYALVIWNFGWFAVFVVATLCHLFSGTSTKGWATFWHLWVWTQILIGVPATVWFTIGGISDMRKLIRRLFTLARDAEDDGRVVRNRLAAEVDDSQEQWIENF